MANKFVFVVCGSHEHVETLHFSLHSLSQFSKNEILVVTDSSRNEIPVQHANIVDIRTPENLNHHQASIFLKTSLYKTLPEGNLYCYLDTDVVALSNEVDEIFNYKNGVINFAADHSRMPRFSPYAVNCGCLTHNKKRWKELDTILNKYDASEPVTDAATKERQAELKREFELIKQNRISFLKLAAQYVLPTAYIHIEKKFYYDKSKRIWFDADGRAVLYDVSKNAIAEIERNTSWRWNPVKRRWISPDGKDIHELECNHLKTAIEKKFDLKIADENWQHWNGGVFLFDSGSKNFMHLWHLRTMKIFKDPHWKTRDQGTLIATAWQLGLQNSPLLSKKFNFIADPSNPRLMLSDDRKFITDDAFQTQYSPAFIHVFHHFGNSDWEIWNWVTEKLKNIKTKGA